MIPTSPNPPEASAPEHPALDLARRLDTVFLCLLDHVAAVFRILGPFTNPAWTRLSRTRVRLAGILRRIAAGTYPPPRAPRPPQVPPTKGGPPPPFLPRRRGWLGHAAGYQVRNSASQLRHLLARPETHAILAAAPPHARAAFGRAIRTTARLLAIDLPPALQPPPKPPRPPKPRTTPNPGANGAATPPSPAGRPPVPLPDYVRAAVRAWRPRFG